jgi:hypothetical protein
MDMLANMLRPAVSSSPVLLALTFAIDSPTSSCNFRSNAQYTSVLRILKYGCVVCGVWCLVTGLDPDI